MMVVKRNKNVLILIFVLAIAHILINTLYFPWNFSNTPTFYRESKFADLSTTKADPLVLQLEQYQTTNNNKFAIFFNTFSRSESTDLAKSIITSQLQEINAQPLLKESPIFYTRIGNYTDWEWPHSLCQGANLTSAGPSNGMLVSNNSNETTRVCTQIAAVPTGDEMITLSKLYTYCQSPENHESIVIYMHSKGTFTSSSQNDSLRAVLMKAILSNECLLGTTNNNKNVITTNNVDLNNLTAITCDTCSTRFNFLPFSAYMGNMFVAKCNYVSKLIPPNEFEKRKQQVIHIMKNATTKITLANKRNIYETKLDNQTSYNFREKDYMWIERKSWIGVGRYAAEHWIASHPDIRPCEVFPEEFNPAIIYGRLIPLDRFQKPNLTSIQDMMTTNVSKRFWSKTGKFYHPWYSDKGKLFEFQHLYGAVPKNHSWFYTFWSQY